MSEVLLNPLGATLSVHPTLEHSDVWPSRSTSLPFSRSLSLDTE